uniref:Cleavage and polyadenylation specificity factor subunit 4 n=1 Tax=Sciurus vulgaris TaxID=55149 RepID=A0A8D2B6I2_SCIVU
GREDLVPYLPTALVVALDKELRRGMGSLATQGSTSVCPAWHPGPCSSPSQCPGRMQEGSGTSPVPLGTPSACSGDCCSFLHQKDNASRMPKCYFYSRCGDCHNKECSFLHLKPASKSQDCPWYAQGFCSDGPLCKYRHVPQIMYPNYFNGFCPEGPKCQFTQK